MRKLSAALTVLACASLAVPQASAIPPGGPGPNTPGTSVVIQDPGHPVKIHKEQLSVTATGFAPNAKFGVKVDDGRGYSNTGKHGAGNLIVKGEDHFDANGNATFIITAPCGIDLSIKDHTVRVLSKADDKMYTSLSVNTFKVDPSTQCG